MRNRVFSLIVAAALLLSMFSVVSLAEPTDTCTLEVNCLNNGKSFDKADVSVYLVGETDTSGKVSLVGAFSGYPVVIDYTSSSGLRDTAITLDSYAVADGIAPDYTGLTNGNGTVTFTGLQTGVYLVDIKNITDEDGTTYMFEPFIVFLPYAESETGSPSFSVRAFPKSTAKVDSDSSTFVHVIKKWNDAGFAINRPESVTVRLICDGETYDTRTLTEADNWRYTWENLDADHSWKVVEDGIDIRYVVLITSPEKNSFVITNTRTEDIIIPLVPIIVVPSVTGGIAVPVITASILTAVVITGLVVHHRDIEIRHKSDAELPNTGLLWWPVPVLSAAGMALTLLGVLVKKKDEEDR